MKPKYTTEGLRERVLHYVSVYGGVFKGKTLTNGETTDEILNLVSVQQAALIEEIEQRLPEKIDLEGKRNGTHGRGRQYTKAQGANETIEKITETLEERIAELKGGNVTNSLTTVQLREEIRKLYGVKKSHYINFEPRLEQLMSLVKDHDEYIIGPDLSIKLPSGNIDPRKEAINEEKVAARNRAGGY